MADLFSVEARRNPYPVYERIRSHSPVAHDPKTDCWMILNYGDARRALMDHATFSSSLATETRQSPDWLVFADPPRHTKLRALVSRAFTPQMVAAFEPRLRELSKILLDALTREGGEGDLAFDYAVPLPMLAIGDLIGIPAEDGERFKRWSDAIMGLSYTISGGDEAARAAGAYREATGEMREYLAAALSDPARGGLLATLARAEVDGEKLNLDEILGFFQLLLSAGHETTANLISNATLCLVEHPDVQARLRERPDLIPAAIEEVLRYRSPVQLMFRMTKADVATGGQTIPAGKLVLVMIGAANRDPAQFEAAEQFEAERTPNQHLAFGAGAHFCLGASLARMEARIALSDLLSRFERIEPTVDDWEPHRALHVLGPRRLPVRLKGR